SKEAGLDQWQIDFEKGLACASTQQAAGFIDMDPGFLKARFYRLIPYRHKPHHIGENYYRQGAGEPESDAVCRQVAGKKFIQPKDRNHDAYGYYRTGNGIAQNG